MLQSDHRRTHAGFTLIELLVVIAIIGILASIILASVAQARNKSGDAAIKSDFNSMLTQAEIVVGNNNNYSNVCSDPIAQKALAAAKSASPATQIDSVLGNIGASTKITCHGNVSGWAVAAPLQTNNSIYWCVDSTGNATSTTNPIAANAVVCT